LDAIQSVVDIINELIDFVNYMPGRGITPWLCLLMPPERGPSRSFRTNGRADDGVNQLCDPVPGCG
jgi:hypothetical protein